MLISIGHTHWAERIREAVHADGYAVVENMLSESELQPIRRAMYAAQQAIVAETGNHRLERAGEYGVLRCMMKFDDIFIKLLENSAMLALVDALLSVKAILHLQNGFILASYSQGQAPSDFQNNFHRDFPRYLNGYVASINILLAIDAFTEENGATRVVPGTHQKPLIPDRDDLLKNAVDVLCPAGGAVVFDSTLWHASGINLSGHDRLAINHQFTPAFFKPQIDYVRNLGEGRVAALPERTQQLLGMYSRVPASLDEYYRPENERLYRKGQG